MDTKYGALKFSFGLPSNPMLLRQRGDMRVDASEHNAWHIYKGRVLLCVGFEGLRLKAKILVKCQMR